jgi:hypothetical protein
VKQRRKPTSAVRDMLELSSKATYAALTKACIAAIVGRADDDYRVDILIEFSYIIKFPKGFPKGVLVEKTASTNIYRVKAMKLLDWLHSEGHSTISYTDLMTSSEVFARYLSKLQKSFDIADEPLYNEECNIQPYVQQGEAE